MTRYYFDILDGKDSVRDDEGAEFDSSEAAAHTAIISAGEIGQNRLEQGETSDIVIEVRDEQNQRVFTIRATMKIEWHAPQHQGPHPYSA